MIQNYDTAAPIAVVLDVPGGRVQLIAADRADAVVEVLPADPSKHRDVTLADLTTVDFRDGVLRIDASTRNEALGDPGSLDVTVKLPAGSRIDVTAARADIRGVGRFGDAVVTGSQGSITLDEAASARLTTLAGSITLGRVHGAAQLSTAQGDVQVAEAARDTVQLRTQAGNVSVGAAAGVSASLDAGTGYGRIHNSLRNTEGAADLQIHATTGYGDITARSL